MEAKSQIPLSRGRILRAGHPTPPRVTVCLFATNQPETAGEHRDRDTIELAGVLKGYLPERFPRVSGGAHVEDVRIVEIRGNPSYYDEMYEYFGEQLDGYAFSQFGWVQSYGSRCVKPPILFGDISRKIRLFGGPIAEGAAETVCRDVGTL